MVPELGFDETGEVPVLRGIEELGGAVLRGTDELDGLVLSGIDEAGAVPVESQLEITTEDDRYGGCEPDPEGIGTELPLPDGYGADDEYEMEIEPEPVGNGTDEFAEYGKLVLEEIGGGVIEA